jgi:hypothetical protein
MMPLRWISFFVAILVGAVIGLYYGWVINPVQYVDTTPASLRDVYKTDYVWMVAEAYQIEHNPELAARRLALLGGASAQETVQDALLSATQANSRDVDLQRIRNLENALQNYNSPSMNTPPVKKTP